MSTDKLKVILDDLKNRIRVSESKIELHTSILECQKNSISQLAERKDNTDKLKQNHIQFTDTFNATVKTLHAQMDNSKEELKQHLNLHDEKREDLRKDMENKILELNTKIETLSKMLDI